jgi:signal transduction histidine kinase
MKSVPAHKNRILALDIVLLLVSFIGVYQLAVRPAIPVSFIQKPDGVYFHRLDLTGDAGIQPDIKKLLSIDGKPVSSATGLEFTIDAYAIGDTVVVHAMLNGEPIIRSFVLVHYYDTGYILTVIAVGLLYWITALILLMKRPDDTAARVFHYACIMVGLIIMNTWGRYTIDPFGLGYLIRILNTIGYILTPVLFVHFVLLFPARRPWAERVIRPLYAVAVAVIVWISASFVLAAEPLLLVPAEAYVASYSGGRILFSVCVLFSVGSIIANYLKSKDESERRKLRWIIMGLVSVPIVFIGLWQLPQVFRHQELISEEIVIIFSAIIPITITIAIMRHHLFDIDRIFSRATVYTIVIAVILGIYIGIVSATADLLGRRFAASMFVGPAVAAVIVALLFDPLRRMVQTFVDRTFFRVKYDYREALRKFSDEIKEINDRSGAAALLVRTIETLMPVRAIGIAVVDEQGRTPRFMNARAISTDSIRDRLPAPGQQAEKELIVYACNTEIELAEGVRVVERSALPEAIVFIATFPIQNDERRWLLLLGTKLNGTRFSIEDVDLIRAFVYQCSLTVDRILLQRKLFYEQVHARQLEELNQMKSFFVSSVSHDLKTPLTSIRMFAEILQTRKKSIPKSEKEYLEIIQGESERLARLIDNVLEFTKIERGVKEYSMTQVSLNSVVKFVIRIFQYQFELQSVTSKMNLSRRSIIVNADHDALIQVLTNLIANAIKYSPDSVHISVSTGVQGARAFVKIADKGMGIDAQELSKIFEPYYRSPSVESRQMDGTGLGLALVRHIIHAHNGTIDVRSDPGKGSTFTVFLPAVKADSRKKAASGSDRHPG